MKRAIVVAFHKYQPFGGEFYEPLLDFFLKSMTRFRDEYDHIYILDSTWNVDLRKIADLPITLVNTPVNLRYYDAYKMFLPDVKEDLVLFMDNDMVVYKSGAIKEIFTMLQQGEADIVSIYDTIGEWNFPELGGKSKICPYLLCSRVDLLNKYLHTEWGPNMPIHETLGGLTKALIDDKRSFYEMTEDKSNCLIDGEKNPPHGKNLGYYHVRAGSTPAYLLSEKKYGNPETYWSYIHNQPKTEYIRQCAWYRYMGGDPTEIVMDSGYKMNEWDLYYHSFLKYHGI